MNIHISIALSKVVLMCYLLARSICGEASANDGGTTELMEGDDRNVCGVTAKGPTK